MNESAVSAWLGLQRAWQDSALARAVWSCAVLSSVAAVFYVGWYFLNEVAPGLAQEQTVAQRLAAEGPGTRDGSSSTSDRALNSPADFVASLGDARDSTALLRELKRLGDEAGVQVSTLSVAQREASFERLGLLELGLNLQGSYPAVMQVLKELHERYPQANIRSLQMRRAPQGLAVDSVLVMVFWSQAKLASVATSGTRR
ncbi:MAG: hypothetical protein IV107_18955 [Paucibacter sp.]|nr:hypothetical protein [Roseateles sp.]